MKLNRAKGTRDFLPEEKIVRNTVVDTMRKTFEQYGFNPLETPVLERIDVLSSKYAGGAEILKETFQLQDQGKRDLGLRYDLTVPFARIIAMNKGLRMPYKRYAIGRVFRDGPLKLGRYREFWQCDVDIVGCTTVAAETELLTLAQDVFKALAMDVVLTVNDRRVIDAIITQSGVPNNKQTEAILIVDKLDKVGEAAVQKELCDTTGISSRQCKELLMLLQTKGTNDVLFSTIKEAIGDNEGLTALQQLCTDVEGLVFSPALARGLTYYTGSVYEAFLTDGKKIGITSSLAGGGRYDQMIGDFIGGKDTYPALGLSFGLDVITDALKLIQATPVRPTVVDVYVIGINCFDQTRQLVTKLRAGGLKVDTDLLDRGLGKNMNYASKAGIPYVVLLGEQEINQKKVRLKNMETGDEQLLTENECFTLLEKALIR